MKKFVLLFAVMLAIVASIGYAPITLAAETVSIQKIIEVVPPRFDTQKPNNCIAMQAVWDPSRATWRRQVIPLNGATTEMVTEEMKNLAAELVPTRNGLFDWESWKFTIIYPSDGGLDKVVAKTETVPAKSAIPLPKIAAPASDPSLKAEIDALKVKFAAAEAAEAKRLKDAKPAAPAKPAVAVKRRQPAISPLAACKANLRNLENGKAAADKSLGECQAGLKTANSDLETAKKANAEEVAKAEKKCTGTVVKLQEDLKKAYDNVGYSPWIVALLALLAFLAGIVAAIFVKKLATAGKTPPATPARGSKAP